MKTFTPMIFGTNGRMDVECHIFLMALKEKLAKKTGEYNADTMTYIRQNCLSR